jgi:toxin secretion/phage lysis holin
MEGTNINYDFISTQLFSLATSVAFTGTLLVLMMCDIAIGTIVAWTDKKISSSTSFRGIGKKVIMLIAVGVGAAVGKEANMPLGQIIAGYYCVTELWSIVENMAMAGVPFPPQVVDVLEKLNPGVKRNTLPTNSSPLPSEEKAEPK